jgi:hypothetical protein
MTLNGVSEKQTITIKWAPIAEAGPGEIVLSFTDWRNEAWTTWPITVGNAPTGAHDQISVIEVEEALRSLPNHAITSVDVTFVEADVANFNVVDLWTYTLEITFTHAQNSGIQNTIMVESTPCTTDGCQPINTGINVAETDVGDGAGISYAKSQSATTENAVCSNRGMCDTESGLCTCLDGYYGQACESQTVIL